MAQETGNEKSQEQEQGQQPVRSDGDEPIGRPEASRTPTTGSTPVVGDSTRPEGRPAE